MFRVWGEARRLPSSVQTCPACSKPGQPWQRNPKPQLLRNRPRQRSRGGAGMGSNYVPGMEFWCFGCRVLVCIVGYYEKACFQGLEKKPSSTQTPKKNRNLICVSCPTERILTLQNERPLTCDVSGLAVGFRVYFYKFWFEGNGSLRK